MGPAVDQEPSNRDGLMPQAAERVRRETSFAEQLVEHGIATGHPARLLFAETRSTA
jgi:hypothetical protein